MPPPRHLAALALAASTASACSIRLPIPDGSTYVTTECRDVVDAPGARGDSCTSIFSGQDSCDRGLFCHNDRCVANCQGPELGELSCPDWSGCDEWENGIVALCLEICDPFTPNCIDGEKCVYNAPAFICIPDDGTNLGLFEPCILSQECAEGLACLLQPAQECDPNEGCCTPICNAANMDPCPGVGQTCVAIDPNALFNGDLGLCFLQ